MELTGTAYLDILLGDDITPLSSDITDFILIESINTFLPVLQLTIKDRGNLILGSLALSGNDEIKVRISNDYRFEQTEDYYFELFSIKDAQLSSLLDATSTVLKLTAWPPLWKDLFQGDKVKSFGYVNASNVIKDIIEGDTEIENSVDKQSYIQAQWTNAQMIRHVASHAYNGSTGGYWYFFDRYLKFYFCCPTWLWKKGVKHNLEFVNKEDKNIRIIAWKLISNYKTLLLQSGYGSDIKYFDYDNKSYWEKNILYTDLNVGSLSKFVFLEEKEVNSGNTRSIYLGNKNEDISVPGSYKIMNRISGLFDLEVLVLGTNTIKLGELVNVYLLQGNKAVEIMDTLSGVWLISKIIHRIETRTNQYTQKLVLSRDSINSKDKKGLVQARLGMYKNTGI